MSWYRRSPSSRLVDPTVRPNFLPRVPLMNPRTLWACQPVAFMTSARVAPPFRSSRATTVAVLLPSRAPPAALACLAPLAALGAFFAGAAFLVALPLVGAPLAACALPLALGSTFGLAVSPRLWILSQMRPAATLAVLKLFTGFTPGRLFQTATSRSGGQPAASSARSCWLAKESNGVVVVAAASSWVPNAVMLLSELIVKVFI